MREGPTPTTNTAQSSAGQEERGATPLCMGEREGGREGGGKKGRGKEGRRKGWREGGR